MSRILTTATISVLILLIVPLVVNSLDVRATNEEVVAAAPPGRPGDFQNPDELHNYLKALNDYYAIAGRPR